MYIDVKQILTRLLIFSVLFTATFNAIDHIIHKNDLSKKQISVTYTNDNEEESENNGDDFDTILHCVIDSINYIFSPQQPQLLPFETSPKLLTNYIRLLKPPPNNNF